MTPNLPTEAQCRRQSAILNRALPHVFDYARRKRLVNAPFAQYAELEEEWEKYPENWEDNVLGMLAGNAVCGARERCAGLVRSVKNTIPEDELALLRGWRSVPWTWSVFRVAEDLGDSRLIVRPLGEAPAQWPDGTNWEELVVYSPAITRNYHEGKTLVLAFLVRIDAIFHTYGVVLPFTSNDAPDMLAYADMARAAALQRSRGIVEPVAGNPERVTDLNEIIRQAPLDFLRLFTFAEAPTLTGRNGLWRNNRAAASRDFAEDAASLLLDGDRPMYDPTIYVSFGDRRVFLHATTDDAYQAGREALSGVVEIPATPTVSVSLLMATAAKSILGDFDEISYLQSAFDAGPDEDAEQDTEALVAELRGQLPFLND